MIYLLINLVFFVLVVVTHIGVCRRYKGKGLLVKAFCVMATAGLLLAVAAAVAIKGQVSHWSLIWQLPLFVTAMLIYILLVPTYIIFYVSTQLNSPSKEILLLIKKQGSMSREQLAAQMTDDKFIRPRLVDLKQTDYVTYKDSKYRLNPSGIKVARFLNFYQWLLGRELGG
jgi:hypothetical protein